MQTVTAKQLASWNPYENYAHSEIEKLFASKKTPSALDILESDIPTEDKLWTVLREELIPASMLYEFACLCMESALILNLKIGYESDPQSLAAIDARRKWLRGEITKTELDAAWSVPEVMPWVEPWDIARNAAIGASERAAWVTVRVVTGAAPWDVTRAAKQEDWEGARSEQIEMLKELLLDEESKKGKQKIRP